MASCEKNIWLIVVTYNAEEWLPELSKSIENSLLQPMVVIVDNHSSDNTVTIAKSLFPTAQVSLNKTNQGFGRANNTGIQQAVKAGAKYVFLLNQDAKLTPTTLSELLSTSNSLKDDRYAIYSPMHLDYAGEKIDPFFLTYLSDPRSTLISDLLFSAHSDIYEFPFLPAAAWMIDCEVLREVGGFDPLFFMYGEDFDLCLRVKRAGYKIGLVPHARVCHHHGGFPRSLPSTKKRIWDIYWQLIVNLKDPDIPFFVSLCLNVRNNSFTFIRLLFSLRLRSIYCLTLAWMRVISRLSIIQRHRNICCLKAGAFLFDS